MESFVPVLTVFYMNELGGFNADLAFTASLVVIKDDVFMSAFFLQLVGKKVADLHSAVTALHAVSCFEAASVANAQLDLHCAYDLSVLTRCCTTLSPSRLCFSSHFLSLLLMRDQSVFVHAGWQLSAMFTTPEGEASRSQSRWGGLVRPLTLAVSLHPNSLFKHFGWARTVEQQQAYRVAKSLCVCWGDSVSCIMHLKCLYRFGFLIFPCNILIRQSC